ncbi:hypothetical protein J6590_073782 [Homalodisca vitripennis]|nr:hypothetical protein J6590_073782 [Homalodisca vitripennis]
MVNDLSACVTIEVILYEDDTTTINTQKINSQAVKSRNFVGWLTANFTVLFGIKEKSGLVDLPKFLGFTLDSTLNWSTHIIGLKKKLSSSNIYGLKCLCGELDQDGLRQAYCGLFQSHMMYGLLAWMGWFCPCTGCISCSEKSYSYYSWSC